MALSESYLKSLHDRTSGGPPPTVTDRKCRKCGYSLKGLPASGVCPECGTPFAAARVGRFCDNLTDAPIEYLCTLRGGLLMLGLAVAVLVLGLVATLFLGFGALAGASLIVSVLWMIGVWVAVTPRPDDDGFAPDPLLDSRPLTQACRAIHAAPILAALLLGAAVASFSTPPMSTTTQMLLGAAGGAFVLAALGLIPLGIYLSAVSDWAGADTLGAQFRVAVFMLIAATVMAVGAGMVSVVSPGFRSGIAGLATMWAAIILVLAALFFLLLLVRLINAAHWAVLNAHNAMDTEARIAERRKMEAIRLTEPQRTAKGSREGHGGSWRDSGFLTIDGDEIPE